MPLIYQSNNKSNSLRASAIKVERKHIKDAYFAIRKEEPVYEGTPSTHTVVSGDTLSKIANNNSTTVAKIKTDNGLTSDLITIGQELTLGKATKKGDKVSFIKIKEAKVGEEVYIIVKTKSARELELKINIKQGVEDGVAKMDEAIIIQQEDKNTDCIKATVGDYCKEKEITNKDDFADWAIAKVVLQPKDTEKQKEWSDALDCLQDKKSKLYVLVDAHSDNKYHITYHGRNPDDEGKPDHKTCPNFWLDMDGKWFELGKQICYCDRDLTEKEVKDIIITMRKSETSVYQGNDKENLFFKDNCDLSSNDKTFKRFTEELNSVFKEYDINTCLRRIHFLAQVYHETDRFRTTKEYNETASYAPHIGRGLMQLTWESNYKKYKSYSNVDCIDDPEVIANNLKNAFDSAGWFWKQGKVLSVGTTWTPPSTAPSYVTVNAPSYSKTTITYQDDNGNSKSYGTVDMNLIADDDYVDVISWLVNGGGNGLTERQDYLEELKNVFEYDTNCENKD